MPNLKIHIAICLFLGFLPSTTSASLIPYNSSDQNVVYSTISNSTWTEDANLLGTMILKNGFMKTISDIISTSPTIENVPNFYDDYTGIYTVTASDFSNNTIGLTNWFGAQAFVKYLNSTHYAGSKQWTLPSNPFNEPGYNKISTSFGQLFYEELGGQAENEIPKSSYFINAQIYGYWMGTENAPSPQEAWIFRTDNGYLSDYHSKNELLYIWATTPGSLTKIPIPGALWLFLTGLLVSFRFKNQKKTLAKPECQTNPLTHKKRLKL